MAAVCPALALAACDDGPSGELPPELADGPGTSCAVPPINGAVLSRDTSRGTGPHTVEIANGDAGDTIVNVRDAASGDIVVSFFVAQGETASVSDLPDGRYRIQYATGGELAVDCSRFAAPTSATQDPETVEFAAGSATVLTYELTPVEDGNFDGQAIEPGIFAAD